MAHPVWNSISFFRKGVKSFLSISPIAVAGFKAFLHQTYCLEAGPDLLSVSQSFKTTYNKESNTDWLFGMHPISCALEAKRRSVHAVFYRRDLLDRNLRIKEIVELCQEENIPVKPVSRNKLDSLLHLQTNTPHQGIIAKMSRLYYTPVPCSQESVERLAGASQNQVWLLLHEIQDPMNFGSILRTSYFLGVHMVFVSSKNNCSLTPVVSKASSGAMELMPIHSLSNVSSFCHILRTLNWDVVATESPTQASGGDDTSTPLLSYKPKNSSLVILGNEGKGLPNELIDVYSHKIFVESCQSTPGKNQVDSMNVSAAAAVIVHHLLNSHK